MKSDIDTFILACQLLTKFEGHKWILTKFEKKCLQLKISWSVAIYLALWHAFEPTWWGVNLSEVNWWVRLISVINVSVLINGSPMPINVDTQYSNMCAIFIIYLERCFFLKQIFCKNLGPNISTNSSEKESGLTKLEKDLLRPSQKACF